MSLINRTWEALREESARTVLSHGKYELAKQVSTLYPGENIFNQDWDLLIILDACRYDLLEEISDEFSFIQSVKKKPSVGSKTTEWMERTFTEEYRDKISRTCYVCGNPNSNKFLSGENFALLDEVWEEEWDDDLGTLQPRPVTERAISVGRSLDPQRLLVHYMQPHEPFISNPDLGGQDTVNRKIGDSSEGFRSVWNQLESGKISKDTAWGYYKENLRCVLNDVELLLENVDADRTIITSDHGNAFGEFGIYGHPRYRPIPALRNVPWVETTASDKRTHTPDITRDENVTGDVEERLRDLGYV